MQVLSFAITFYHYFESLTRWWWSSLWSYNQTYFVFVFRLCSNVGLVSVFRLCVKMLDWFLFQIVCSDVGLVWLPWPYVLVFQNAWAQCVWLPGKLFWQVAIIIIITIDHKNRSFSLLLWSFFAVIFSSPEHKVLKVSFYDGPLSVVRRPSSVRQQFL